MEAWLIVGDLKAPCLCGYGETEARGLRRIAGASPFSDIHSEIGEIFRFRTHIVTHRRV